MSLHLANLSPRMRKDELERVFRKFGRCTVQLKDGFGFAVYEYRGDAEEALRTLKGRKICGESVYLSWSNKQPKPLQRFTRAARSHEIRYGRNSDRGDNFVGHGDYSMNDKDQPDKGQERHESPVIQDDKQNLNFNDAGLAHCDQREVIVKKGGHVEVEPTHMDDGRWGEQVDNCHNDTGYGQMGFDRYDPNRVDDRGEVYENRALDHFTGLQSVGTSPDKKKRLHRTNKRGQPTCFKCGAAGHKMRDCPLKEALQGKNTYHSDLRHDTKAKNEFGRAETRPGEHLQSRSRNLRSERKSDTDRKLSHSENGLNQSSSPVANESRWDRRKDYNRNRQQKGDDQILESWNGKKLRVSALSHLHSDCVSPELSSYSRPSKPLVELNSHFKSRSPGPNSISARSRSNSRLCRSRSRRYKTKSRSRTRSRPRPKLRSRSRTPSSSLSISLGQSLPSSSNKAEVNLNGFSEGGPSPLSKEVLSEVRQCIKPEAREENMSIANREEQSLIGYSDKPTSYQSMEFPIERKQSEHDTENPTSSKHTELCLNGFVEDFQSPRYQEAVPEERQQVESVLNYEPPQTEAHLQREDLFSSVKVIDDMKLDPLLNDAGSVSIAAHVFCEVDVPSSSLLEKDGNESAVVKMSVKKSRETEENENSNPVEITNSLELANNSDVEAHSKLNVGGHLSISSEELSSVLKHYGLKHPKENEQQLDVGNYFGSSRLWPWEMIYYRRLKKGLISVENYAKRIAQNEAYHITDKYIRSSSGWSEPLEEHC